MFVDGQPVDDSFSRKTGFCQQMDIHDETSTIREAFEFSALLRQGRDVRKEDKLSYVDSVLGMLGLVELQDALIRSLDIEKKKRVTIGVELCAKPKLLLFLDEPTSGLDSQGASTIVDLLRRLADQGLAILCTVHQANEEQFEQVGKLPSLLLTIPDHGYSLIEYWLSAPVETHTTLAKWVNRAGLSLNISPGTTKSKWNSRMQPIT